MMLDKYPTVKKFIQSISLDFQEIFGDNLVAIYVTGSLTTDSYIEGLSDIDMIVVINEKTSPDELENLKIWAENLPENDSLSSVLDISMVQRKNIVFGNSVPEEALEFYNKEINYAKNALGNSPIVWDQILKNGITVFGPNPQEILTMVPWEKILEALKSELTTIEDRIDTHFEDIKFRYYVIATLCRILYTIETKSYTSKEEALYWYRDSYGLHTEIINAALYYIKRDENHLTKTQKEDYKIFAREVSGLL